MKEYRCHDCNVLEGEIHGYGCDMERCPFCGRQLITCACCFEHLGIDISPDSWAWHNGLTIDQKFQWIDILEMKGRIPYIIYPNICARCGELWPKMFHVPDEEWNFYVTPNMRGAMLCLECYNEIKQLICERSELDIPTILLQEI